MSDDKYCAKEQKANARLIAAAPELLAALQMMERAFCAPDPDALIAFAVIERARDVIKKAGGVI